MRQAVKITVGAAAPPPELEARLRAAMTPRWLRPLATTRSFGPSRSVVAAAAIVIMFVVWSSSAFRAPVGAHAANAMDRLALRLEDTRAVVLEGTILCRDCELEHRYGIEANCRSIGHHGAIATPDGRIWNIVEQRSSAGLIHDASLLGRKVLVRGRLFRGARAVVVDSYRLES